MRMLTSHSIEEILLQWYMNWSNNFRCLLLKMEKVPSCLNPSDLTLFNLLSFSGHCFLLLSLPYAVGIQCEQMYFA